LLCTAGIGRDQKYLVCVVGLNFGGILMGFSLPVLDLFLLAKTAIYRSSPKCHIIQPNPHQFQLLKFHNPFKIKAIIDRHSYHKKKKNNFTEKQ
jgi:hypothetical protein